MRLDDVIRATAEIKESENDEGRADEEKKTARERAVKTIRSGLARDLILGMDLPGRGHPRGVPNRNVEPE